MSSQKNIQKSFAIETVKEQVVLNQSGLLGDDDEWLSINTISTITERIFCSGYAMARSPPKLQEFAIRGVLTIGDMKIPEIVIDNYRKNKIAHLQLNIEDNPDADISKHFSTVNDFISQFNEKKLNVLVHCDQGISRSPAIILYYMVAKLYKKSKPDHPVTNSIYKYLQTKRHCIDINQGFLKAIEAAEMKLR